MTLARIHMFAEIFGSLFLVFSSSVIVFELRQNIKQERIQNTFMRQVEVERMQYKQMEENIAVVVSKGLKSYFDLEDFEKIQFENYVLQRHSIFTRGYSLASEASITMDAINFKKRIKAVTKDFFSNPGVIEAFKSMQARGVVPGGPIANELLSHVPEIQIDPRY